MAVEVEVEVNLRRTGSLSVWLGFWLPSRAHDQIFLLSDNYGFLDVERPIWREDGSVIYSYNCFWTFPEQSLSGPSLIWGSPNVEGQVPVFISPRNRVAKKHPRALSSLLVASYDSQNYGGGILTRLHMGFASRQSKSKSHYNRQWVGQSVLVSGAHLGPATNFSISLRFSLRQLRFVIL
jgi:hypothetical protein